MFLFTNKQKSIFISNFKIKKDSLQKLYLNDFYTFLDKKKQLKGKDIKYIIEKNLNNKSYTFYNMYLFRRGRYNDNLPKLKWQLKKESKNILGYKCFLAETSFAGRNYTAWFTNDIPLSDGPYKFTGLPGLILEIYDTEKLFHFTLIGIENSSFNILNKYKLIKKEQETKFRKGVEQEIINRAIGDSKKSMKTAIKKRNNNLVPIELY